VPGGAKMVQRGEKNSRGAAALPAPICGDSFPSQGGANFWKLF